MAEALVEISAPITRVAPGAIRLERLLDAPAETVWRYLTEAELRSQWFMGGSDATPGGEFELLNDHDNLSDDDVPYPESYAPYKGKTWQERVLRFEPPRLLETTFQSGKNGDRHLRAAARRRAHPAGADPQRDRERHGSAGFRQRLELAHDRAAGAPGGAQRARFLGAACTFARGGQGGTGRLDGSPLKAGMAEARGRLARAGRPFLWLASVRSLH